VGTQLTGGDQIHTAAGQVNHGKHIFKIAAQHLLAATAGVGPRH
jgi:hypothetical protein